MASGIGISDTRVLRIWHAHGLKPDLSASFKVSNDPHILPGNSKRSWGFTSARPNTQLCVDEKIQMQALDRTQPGLPLKRGRAETKIHNYKRRETTTMLAAMNAASGKVINLCQQRHRHQEWLKFLRLIDVATPPDLQIHLIADNYATQTCKGSAGERWLKQHPRFHAHFTRPAPLRR